MNKLSRLSLMLGVFNLTSVIGISIVYYVLTRPSYINPTFKAEFTRRLNNPQRTIDELRTFALGAHETIFAGFTAFDTIVNLFIVTNLVAAAGFMYFCYKLNSKIDISERSNST